MSEYSMSRDTLFLCVFSLLATASVISSYQWMDQHPKLDSRQAIHQAQKLLTKRYPTHSKLQLINVSPPNQKQTGWLLSFRKKQGGTLQVRVQENGQSSLI